jgi:heat shock protein HslJ
MRSALLFVVLALSLGAGCSNAPDPMPKTNTPAAPDATHLGVWYWIGTTVDGQAIVVVDPTRYRIDFADASTMLVQADCNKGRGGYTLDAGRFAAGPIGLTKMGCPEDSQDLDFLAQLASARSLAPAADRLRIELSDDRGTMQFARDPKAVLAD